MPKYTNSSLVSVKMISPNKTSPRTHSIDTLTIHCFVGQVTAKRGCEVFMPVSKQASCNYVVGKDGDIGMSVEEKDRSWCSSSRENDHRAITIETASDTSSPYAVTDKAFNSLLDLCTDVCKRNGKKKLIWFGDKNKTLAYKPKSDEMVMTVHMWFKNKSCLPTDRTELLTKKGWVNIKDVNVGDKVMAVNPKTMLMHFSPVTDKVEPYKANCWEYDGLYATEDHRVIYDKASAWDEFGDVTKRKRIEGYFQELMHEDERCYLYNTGTYIGKNTDEKLIKSDRIVGRASSPRCIGVTEVSCVSVNTGYILIRQLGCMTVVGNCPGPYLLKLQPVIAEEVTRRLAGKTPKTINPSTGSTSGTEKKPSSSSSSSSKKPSTSSNVKYRIRKSWKDVDSQIGAYNVLDNAIDECKKHKGYKVYDADGKVVYPKSTTSSKDKTFKEYKVEVDITDLNIRTGPGTNYKKTGKYTGKGVFTIVDEKDGWGKLKSGAGWISLNYTKKVK